MILNFTKFVLVFFTLFILSGCENRQITQNEAYGTGYNKGLEDGKKEGYKAGYEAGFNKNSPGSQRQTTGVWAVVQKALVLLGALKVLISLAISIFLLIKKSKTTEEFVGKLLMAGLGTVVVLWAGMAFSFSGLVKTGLLQPASESMFGWLLIGLFTAVLTYGLFSLLFNLLRKYQSTKVEGWFVFFASAVFTIFTPAFTSMFLDAPNINNYLASEILIGVLMGGTYYLASDFLKSPVPSVEG